MEKSNSTVHYVDTKPSLFQDNFDVLEHNVSPHNSFTSYYMTMTLTKIPCSVSLPIQESSSSMSCLILCWECCFVENHSQFMVRYLKRFRCSTFVHVQGLDVSMPSLHREFTESLCEYTLLDLELNYEFDTRAVIPNYQAAMHFITFTRYVDLI